MKLQILVDADACPVVIKNILFKASERTGIQVTLVANQFIAVPDNSNIKSVQVEKGFDVADDEIVKRTQQGDLVITADIPLAAEVLEIGAQALGPRGEWHTPDNIRARLNMRDFMDTMRASGIQSGGPAALNSSDRQTFANRLDRYLVNYKPI